MKKTARRCLQANSMRCNLSKHTKYAEGTNDSSGKLCEHAVFAFLIFQIFHPIDYAIVHLFTLQKNYMKDF